MADSPTPRTRGRGTNHLRVTRRVAVTFDNLGEASEIEQGAWPPGRPRGRHPSVVRALPRVLALLDDVGVRATFFVEGINAELAGSCALEPGAAQRPRMNVPSSGPK